jgi:putative nucleotidyltransferase with HDIG domain
MNRENGLELSGEKWAETLHNLLDLAISANDGFIYERALGYLTTVEELCSTKALPGLTAEFRTALCREKGRAFSKLGRYGEAVKEFQKVLEINHEKKSLPLRAEVFLEIGQLLAKQGELDSALGHIHRALAAYRRIGDQRGVCKSLRNLGVIYIELGEFEDAETAYTEAIDIAQKEGQNILYADLINNLGAIKNMKGDWEEALACYQTAREAYEREKEVRKSAYTINNIGITLLEREQYDLALKNFIAALKVSETIKDAPLSLILSINLTDLYIKRNDLEEAKRYCNNAILYICSEKLRNSQRVETLKLAGRIAYLEKRYGEALQRFDEALEICRELGLQYFEAEVLYEKGNLFLRSERHWEALQALENSYQIFAQLEASGKVEKTERLIGFIEELYLKIFESMAFNVDQKDPYTKGHSDRVAKLALLLARELGLSDREIKELVAGSLLHDIGKLDISDEILKKKGRLIDEEFQIIKNHPELGVQRLAGIKFPWDIASIIRYHHERYDGKGYPCGLAGNLIPLGARIICVADVFDALTSERPYREAYSTEKALRVMKTEMSGAFDPVIFDIFASLANSGQIDQIINRATQPDELYSIWAECRVKPRLDATKAAATAPVAS